MPKNPAQYRELPVGVVLRRAPGVTRWRRYSWTATAILPGAAPADWKVLRREANVHTAPTTSAVQPEPRTGEIVEYHAATLPLELHGADTEAYLHGLHAQVPCIYVVMRETGDEDRPLEVVTVTASPYEAQDYTDSGEEIVEKVAMSEAMLDYVWDFVEAFHEDEVFIKRKRDKKRVDLKEDGIGDARIVQPADVYRAPAQARKERLH